MIIKEVNNFIITMLEQIDLTELEYIYVALDGVPTFAKILEQKKRRFIGDFVEKLLEKYSLPFNWSKNNISPGTIFMDKINKYLLNIKYITKNKLISKEDLILKPEDYEFFTKILCESYMSRKNSHIYYLINNNQKLVEEYFKHTELNIIKNIDEPVYTKLFIDIKAYGLNNDKDSEFNINYINKFINERVKNLINVKYIQLIDNNLFI
jgi:hypothetical protein